MKFDKILILVDDSTLSQKVVKTGYELAADMGAGVALLHVIDEALAMGDVDAGIFPEEAQRIQVENAQKLLNKFRDDFGKDTETEIFALVGELKKILPDVISQSQAKLIVTGTHRHSGIVRLFTGSMAERALRVATIPMLVLPEKH
jgi:nucleotide-binding universal stress UspA family protein